MEYESPISIYTTPIATQIGEEFDKMVLTAIKKVGVEVDKDELVKALEYDRDQYEKGYLDGRRYKPPIITNADRIRAMSDAELAEFITPVKCIDCHLLDCGVGEIGHSKTCVERTLDWLQQEVDT